MIVGTTTIAPLVEKENVQNEVFELSGLDKTNADEVRKKLFDAMMLGNAHHHKVHIKFNTNEGSKQVYTTVWASTDNFIILKGGRYIPFVSVQSVELD